MDEAGLDRDRASEPVVVADDGGRGNVRGTGDSGAGRRGSAEFSMVPLGWLSAGAGTVAILLYAVQQALRLPSGFGVEDVLGWSTPAIVSAAVWNWCLPSAERWHAAAAYVLVDTAFFMPLYGALVIAAARAMAAALQTGPALKARVLQAGLLPVTTLLLILLWACDALENFGGAERLGLPAWAFFLALTVAARLFAIFLLTLLADRVEQSRRVCSNVGELAVAIIAIAAVVLTLNGQAACEAARQGFAGSFGFAWAHRLKPGAIVLALLPVAIAAVVWWFGIDLDLDDPGQNKLAGARAAWRSGVAGVIGRTRYVLLLLVLFTVFTLVLDQCRDVLLALAGPLGAEADRDFLTLLWRAFVLVTGAISIGILSYSCWLWTRLVGMVSRPGLTLPGAHAVWGQIGAFARGWARAVALAPLVIVCLLIAHAAGDAVSAGRSAPGTSASQTLTATLFYLFLFGALAVLSGYVFLEVRRRLSLASDADYYNSVVDAHALLRTATTDKPHAHDGAAARIGREVVPAEPNSCRDRALKLLGVFARALRPAVHWLVPLTRPIVLPLVSLGLMVLLRIGMACWPDTAAQAPATLALLALALSWWMGVLGALSLAEQRQTIPWGLAIVVVMGVLSWADLVDNHVLALGSIGAATESTLATLRMNGLIVTALLAFLGAVWWLLATYRPAGAAGGGLRRAAIAALTLAISVVGLHLVDRSTASEFAPASAPGDRTMATVWADWVRKLPPAGPTDNRIYLIASEGGGIRSAYWTAQILAGLHDRDGTFDGRVVVLSGVSGGAVGEAVYRACLRLVPGSISDCVRTRFAHLDALSPLIGGFLFEDAFARLLPLHTGGKWSVCGLPGCGYLSRALGFEREWMRQFPRLAEPLGPARAGEPELMLNSTWVESGNRATFATMRMEKADIPASEDAVARLGAEPSLISAAHSAARFPFINPLATVVPVKGEGAGKIAGHLADGGYHDNSGAESLADAWRALRAAKLPASWQPQLVLIRNGQLKPGCDTEGKKEPEVRCLSEAPSAPSDLAAPLTKSEWKLYVDAVGPAVATVNVSGIGAHGRQAPASLSADLGALAATTAPQTPSLPVWLLDQTTAKTLVPLGWYLSPAAREALDVQAKCALQPESCAPRP